MDHLLDTIRAGARSATARAATWDRRAFWAGIVGFCFFVLLAVLVNARVFGHADWVAVRAIARWRAALFEGQPLAWQVLDRLSWGLSILLSAELAVVYALIASVLLWRAGRGWWALAPLAFVLLVPIEANLKLAVDQPLVRPAPHGIRFVAPLADATPYPLTSVPLKGAFPSGHATRTGFLCTFLGVWFWQRPGLARRLGIPGLVVVALLIGFTRIYVRDHWPSDVAAGLVLGAALALLVAPPVVRSRRSSTSVRLARPATARSAGGERVAESNVP